MNSMQQELYDEKSLEIHPLFDKTHKKYRGRRWCEFQLDSLTSYLNGTQSRALTKIYRHIKSLYKLNTICFSLLSHTIPTLNILTQLNCLFVKYKCTSLLSIGCGGALWECLIEIMGQIISVDAVDICRWSHCLLDNNRVHTNIKVRNLKYYPSLVSRDILFIGWPTRNGYDYGAWLAFRGKLVVFIAGKTEKTSKDVGSHDFWKKAIPQMTCIFSAPLPHLETYRPYIHVFLNK